MPKPKRLILQRETSLILLLWVGNLPNFPRIKDSILSELQPGISRRQIKMSVRFHDSMAPFSIGIARRMKASSLVNKSIWRIFM
jgi:hypothetical protein